MATKVAKPPKDELVKLYEKEGSTISSMARQYNTTAPTVRSWLILHGIPRKSHLQASKEANNRHRLITFPTKEELESVYSDNSILSLTKTYNVGQQTIYEWLDFYGIERRTLSDSTIMSKNKQFADKWLTKNIIESNYDRTKSLDALAQTLGLSRSFLAKLMQYHNIERAKLNPSYRSKAEIDLCEWCISEFPEHEIEYCNKTIIAPYELDIVNHTKKIAIEYCGLYWHSEFSSNKDKNYHRMKMLKCKEAGYQLITVFESDNLEKIKSLILKKFGHKSIQTIYARNCIIKVINTKEALNFHNLHHLSNGVGANYHYGLFYGNDLVMVSSFGKNRFNAGFECIRMTSPSNIRVVGGVSKLMKNFIKDKQPEILTTFADLRFGTGESYIYSNFVYVEDTGCNYFYWKKGTAKLYSRVKFQKHKLKDLLESFDSELTEFDNMLNNNYDRIWDCGNAKYIWQKGRA